MISPKEWQPRRRLCSKWSIGNAVATLLAALLQSVELPQHGEMKVEKGRTTP